jgi:hypothetical protein
MDSVFSFRLVTAATFWIQYIGGKQNAHFAMHESESLYLSPHLCVRSVTRVIPASAAESSSHIYLPLIPHTSHHMRDRGPLPLVRSSPTVSHPTSNLPKRLFLFCQMYVIWQLPKLLVEYSTVEGCDPKFKIATLGPYWENFYKLMVNIMKSKTNFGFDFFNYKVEICNYETVGKNIETTDFILQAIHTISISWDYPFKPFSDSL